jgi:hypothetical protein
MVALINDRVSILPAIFDRVKFQQLLGDVVKEVGGDRVERVIPEGMEPGDLSVPGSIDLQVPCYLSRSRAARLSASSGKSRSTSRCQARASSARPIFSRRSASRWYSLEYGFMPSVSIARTS